MSGITIGVDIVPMTCPVCGVRYGVDRVYQEKKYQEGGRWKCPNGDPLIYRENEADRLRKLLEQAEQTIQIERANKETANRRAVSAEMSRRVTKGHLTRLRQRVAHGVCPCCGRTFQQLARHMANKHPNFPQESATGQKG